MQSAARLLRRIDTKRIHDALAISQKIAQTERGERKERPELKIAPVDKKDKRAVRYIKQLCGPIRTKTLSFKEHYELALILIETNDNIVNNYASHCLHSIKNAFGTFTLASLKAYYVKKKTLSESDFLEIWNRMATVTSSALFKLPHIPRQVALADLSDDGRLIVTQREVFLEIIHERKNADRTHVVGRVRKQDVLNRTGQKPTCAAEYFIDEHGKIKIYWLYRGKKYVQPDREQLLEQIAKSDRPSGEIKIPNNDAYRGRHPFGAEFKKEGDELIINWVYEDGIKLEDDPVVAASGDGRLVASGPFSSIKIAQKDFGDEKEVKQKQGVSPADSWRVIKIKRSGYVEENEFKHKPEDPEFKMAYQHGLASCHLFRESPTHGQFQEEIVMQWLPGQDVESLLETKTHLHPLFLFELCTNMLKSMDRFHLMRRALHRDVKLSNFVAVGLAIGIIDLETAKQWDPKTQSIECSQVVMTPSFCSPRIFKKRDQGLYYYDAYTDMYGMKISIAKTLRLISEESQTHFDAEYARMGGSISAANLPPTLKLITADSKEFKNNKTIPDETVRREVLTYLASCDSKTASPSRIFDAGAAFFKNQANKLREILPIRVCLMNVSKFVEKNQFERQTIVDFISQFDVVQLVVTDNKHTFKQLAAVERFLNDFLPNFLGRKVIDLARNPLVNLAKMLKQCTDWHPLKKKYQVGYLDLGEAEYQKTIESQQISWVSLPAPSVNLAIGGVPG